MSIGQKHYNSLKADFEKDNGWALSLQFVNHQHLVKEFLDDYPNEMNFSFKAKAITWKGFAHVQHEYDIFTIKTELHTVGDLIFYKIGKETDRKEISLDLVIEVPCRLTLPADFISYLPESIVAKTLGLKTITDFDEIVMGEFNRLAVLKPLDFAIYNSIWPCNVAGNDFHDFVSGYGYFSEIDNMYRQVRYSIALANTYAHYANRYYAHEVRQPWLHYPINFTSHDRRYLDSCTSAIHFMYVFWERLALLIFQYHQPLKVTSKNLSFANLIGAISKEQIGSKIDMTWFEQFLKSEHAKIQQMRHPLVHYKLDPHAPKGSYVPMIHEKWLKDTRNKQQLLDMEANSKALVGEIINLAEKCREGYEKTLQLIIDLKSAQKTLN
jgi:hypothetical protein